MKMVSVISDAGSASGGSSSLPFRFHMVCGQGNYQGRNFGPSGTQLRARSNFGLGFALTHILIKSDDSHRRKSIFDLAVADFDLAAAD